VRDDDERTHARTLHDFMIQCLNELFHGTLSIGVGFGVGGTRRERHVNESINLLKDKINQFI
jgi:hypothetical protein